MENCNFLKVLKNTCIQIVYHDYISYMCISWNFEVVHALHAQRAKLNRMYLYSINLVRFIYTQNVIKKIDYYVHYIRHLFNPCFFVIRNPQMENSKITLWGGGGCLKDHSNLLQ